MSRRGTTTLPLGRRRPVSERVPRKVVQNRRTPARLPADTASRFRGLPTVFAIGLPLYALSVDAQGVAQFPKPGSSRTGTSDPGTARPRQPPRRPLGPPLPVGPTVSPHHTVSLPTPREQERSWLACAPLAPLRPHSDREFGIPNTLCLPARYCLHYHALPTADCQAKPLHRVKTTSP